ncbi:FAD-binding oxidoreductase [Francisella sp. SYW-9]|uniref:FAD-binding oxidoreductase n=1 Tax=Francisella sp. SYW-9 TaxID=2610888 RepID=UPI00123D1CFB|nr:FAD-binding oxidoreductase [Francisella sp. SYW-9]
MAIEKFQLELSHLKDVASNVKELGFKRVDNKPLNFTPGQFITLLFEEPETGNIKRRSYSLGSVPSNNDSFSVAISYVRGGVASEYFFSAESGQRVNAMGPAGRLVLQDESFRKIVLVGTGTGVVPYKSMFPKLLELADQTEIHILSGVQYKKNSLYMDEFINLDKSHKNIHFKLCLSRQLDDLSEYEVSGYVQDQFKNLDLDPNKDVVYLCGNPNMIEQASQELKNIGFDKKNIRIEKYISPN